MQSPPYIIKQPPTDEVLFKVKARADENDKPFVIECEAEGEPQPQWVDTNINQDWSQMFSILFLHLKHLPHPLRLIQDLFSNYFLNLKNV